MLIPRGRLKQSPISLDLAHKFSRRAIPVEHKPTIIASPQTPPELLPDTTPSLDHTEAKSRKKGLENNECDLRLPVSYILSSTPVKQLQKAKDAEINSLILALAASRRDLENHKLEIQEMKEKEKKTRKKSLKEALIEAEERNKKSKEVNLEWRNENQTIKRELAEKKQELNINIAKLEALEFEKAEIEREKKQKEDKLKIKTGQLDQQKKLHDAKVAKLERQIESCQIKLEEKLKEYSQEQQRCHDLEGCLDLERERIGQLEKDNQLLAPFVDMVDETQKRFEELNAEHQQLVIESRKTTEELSNLRRTVRMIGVALGAQKEARDFDIQDKEDIKKKLEDALRNIEKPRESEDYFRSRVSMLDSENEKLKLQLGIWNNTHSSVNQYSPRKRQRSDRTLDRAHDMKDERGTCN